MRNHVYLKPDKRNTNKIDKGPQNENPYFIIYSPSFTDRLYHWAKS
ncbi:hypothetical protein KL86DYS2_11939 [uncultured Dysgonomonas sp.]|uniref:Uncharacterized protein n=1 Tax=uncultured Dysgonomonas sp. TaxID=206096 RepID=A0A212JNB6_9BACT|nr:hypothetical protein KL86DYS2_11939 [uncultured Dysgonomonas sp.]